MPVWDSLQSPAAVVQRHEKLHLKIAGQCAGADKITINVTKTKLIAIMVFEKLIAIMVFENQKTISTSNNRKAS